MLAVLKQDPNTKRFKLTLIYFNTDGHSIQLSGKSPLSNHNTTDKRLKTMKNEKTLILLRLPELLQLVRCLEDRWHDNVV